MMNKRIGCAALVLAVASGAVGAQEWSGIEEVIVTSRRVSEKLQDVPVAITAFTSRDLEKQAIRSVNDLANYTPNMTFTSGVNGRTAVPVIRGIGIIDGRGFDNAVGVFIDGIFVSGRAAQNAGMLDLERVEVVKGPQSALYGRNTFSGAINYVTRAIPDEVTAKVEGTIATDDLTRFGGSVGGRVNDWFAARLAVNYESDKGTYRNSGPQGLGDGIGGGESKSALLSLQFKPAENVTIDVGGYFGEEFGDNRPLTRLDNNCGQLDPMNPANANLISSDLRNPIYFCGEAKSTGSGFLSMSPAAFSFDNQTKRGTLSVEWELPGVSIQSQSAYTTSSSLNAQDLDRTQLGDGGYGYLPLAAFTAAGSPSFICSGFAPVGPCRGTAPLFNQIRPGRFNTYFSTVGLDTDYWSTELRFTSPRDQRLRWLGGLFYFRSKNDDTTNVGIDASEAVRTLGLPLSQIKFVILDPGAIIPGLSPLGSALALAPPAFPPASLFLAGPGTSLATYTPLIDVQKAVFGSLEFDFTDRLTGTAELRHTKENQDLNNLFDNYFGGVGRFTGESSFTDPRLTLRFKATPEIMFYGSAARGTRSGGINALISDPAFLTYKPETNNTFELGFKSTLADGRMQLNVSAFYIDWTDAQFRQTAPGSTGNGTLVTATVNAGNVKSQGIEISMAAKLAERWLLDANLGVSDPKFDGNTYAASLESLCRTLTTTSPIPLNCVARDIDGNGTIDRIQPNVDGKQLPTTSKLTASLGLEYRQPVLGDASLVARLDAGYRSKQYSDFLNANWAPARTIANLRVGLEREQYDVFLWVENLANEDSFEQLSVAGSTNLAGSVAYSATGINPTQRRMGLTARYRF